MRIAPRLHLVASGSAVGFDLTDAFDCNAWLIETPDGHILFDTGAGRDLDAIFAILRADGIDPAAVRHVFLTHAHADHSGGAFGIVERLRPRLLCGEATAAILAQDDDRLIHLDRARQSGMYPADYVWRAPAVDQVLADGEAVTIADCTVTAIATPGHCDDHLSFLVDMAGTGVLITGDALFAGPRVVLQDIPDCSVPLTLRSIRRLSTLEFDTFLPGHGLFAIRNGRAHVDRAMTYVERMVPPPNLI